MCRVELGSRARYCCSALYEGTYNKLVDLIKLRRLILSEGSCYHLHAGRF